MRTALAAPPGDHFLVPLSRLEPETVLGFDLYLRHASGRAVLYRTKDLSFTADVQARLVENGVRELLVPGDQQPAFEAYLERRAGGATLPDGPGPDELELESLVVNDRVPPRTRSTILTSVARSVVRTALANLGSPGLGARIHRVAQATARFLLEQEGAYAALLRTLRPNLELHEHAVHTALYATELVRVAGLGGDAMVSIGRAALLHDVGAIDLPIDLAERACFVDAATRERVVDHVARGVERLRATGVSDPVCLEVVEYHHERGNGTGYPRGAHLEEVPYPARIVAIADVFDVLTCAGKGRVALSGYQALWRMRRDMEGQFDPRLLALFVRTLLDPGRG